MLVILAFLISCGKQDVPSATHKVLNESLQELQNEVEELKISLREKEPTVKNIMTVSEFLVAVELNDFNAIKDALSHDKNRFLRYDFSNYIYNSKGSENILHLLAYRSKSGIFTKKILELIFEADGAMFSEMILKKNNSGIFPTDILIEEGRTDAINFAYEKGISLNNGFSEEILLTRFKLAIFNNELELAEVLSKIIGNDGDRSRILSKADPHFDLIYWAIYKGNVNFVRLLLSNYVYLGREYPQNNSEEKIGIKDLIDTLKEGEIKEEIKKRVLDKLVNTGYTRVYENQGVEK
ncbi:MAG TPA: hypothetical protein DEP20_01660 [Fusobacteria bacterium]|nr:hypothetical protein [Fusobacteriota bacterium]|tara:strand:+ start:1220 stop:2104 length:885 start_codon:yes stop_codon:yes gene_type:complete